MAFDHYKMSRADAAHFEGQGRRWARIPMKCFKHMTPLVVLLTFLGCYAPREPQFVAGWLTPLNLREPEQFEPYLEIHPDNETVRSAAIVYYSRHRPDMNAERLKHHTYAMIERYPWNLHIFYGNESLLYSDTQYRTQVISQLEVASSVKHHRREIFATLARVCATGAFPPHEPRGESRDDFLKRMGLASDAEIATERNDVLIDKTETYYRRAIDLARSERNQDSLELYTWSLALFLAHIGRSHDAVTIAESAPSHAATQGSQSDMRNFTKAMSAELDRVIQRSGAAQQPH